MLSLFQALVYGVIEAFASLLPLGGHAFSELFPVLLDWEAPPAVFKLLLKTVSAAAIFWTFRHDFLSQISSVIRILVSRAAPKTMDEKLPLFVILGILPTVILRNYITEQIPMIEGTALQRVGYPALASIGWSGILLLTHYWSRQKWALYDWTVGSALFSGLFLLGAQLPGADLLTLALSAGLILNHRIESIGKMTYWWCAPLLLADSLNKLPVGSWSSTISQSSMTALSFWLAMGVTLAVSIAILGFVQQGLFKGMGLKRTSLLRVLVLVATLLAAWLR